jgi:putative ABC transport system permease protein
MLDMLWSDARLSMRTMARRLPTTVITLLTTALGIGATTAIFGIVNAVLIRPLPYPQPDTLVGVWHAGVLQGAPLNLGFSASMYLTYRAENRTFAGRRSRGSAESGVANARHRSRGAPADAPG